MGKTCSLSKRGYNDSTNIKDSFYKKLTLDKIEKVWYNKDMNKDMVDISKFEEKILEIEKLQEEVSKILFNKNPFYKFFYFQKAVRLHEEAGKKFLELLAPLTK